MAEVTIHSDFGNWENKICHCFHVFPFYLPWSDGTECYDLFFECWASSQLFSFSSFTLIKRLFHSSLLSAIRVASPAYLRLVDNSPRNLDSSFWHIQPGISHVLCASARSLSHVWLFATLWTVACQPPLSMGFSRQEKWNGLPFPSPSEISRVTIYSLIIFPPHFEPVSCSLFSSTCCFLTLI